MIVPLISGWQNQRMDGLLGRNVRHRMKDHRHILRTRTYAVNRDVQDLRDILDHQVFRVLRVNLALGTVTELKVREETEDIQVRQDCQGLREKKVHLEVPTMVHQYPVRQP